MALPVNHLPIGEGPDQTGTHKVMFYLDKTLLDNVIRFDRPSIRTIHRTIPCLATDMRSWRSFEKKDGVVVFDGQPLKPCVPSPRPIA
jgi:hypothetical protein